MVLMLYACVVYYLWASDKAAWFKQECGHLCGLHLLLCGTLVLVGIVTIDGSDDNDGSNSNARGYIAEVGQYQC
jgi:hypothetical protein